MAGALANLQRADLQEAIAKLEQAESAIEIARQILESHPHITGLDGLANNLYYEAAKLANYRILVQGATR